MMWLATAAAGKELEVVRALADIGVTAHCAKAVELKRVGKRRRPDVFIVPLLPNYLFIECDDSQYQEAIRVKHIWPTMTLIPRSDIASVLSFLSLAQSQMDKSLAQIEAGERVIEFSAGDLLQVLDGPLSGLTATFKRILDGDRGAFPSVVADVEMMGQTVRASFDVLDVRAAE